MENIREIIINPTFSIKEAMEKMTNSRKGVLLVLNERNYLVGVLSDGDVRRGILNQALLMSPISQIMNTDPQVAYSNDEAAALLREKSLTVVPVLSRERVVTAVLVAEEGHSKFFQIDSTNERAIHDEKILVVIPARGGSKRIPLKNLQKIGGYSLVARAITVARDAFPKANIIVSTDSEQIAAEVERMGIPVPWLRPENLSTDTTATYEVVEHALLWAVGQQKNKLEAVILLEPTAPLRRPHHLTEGVELLKNGNSDSVVCVCEVPHVYHPEELAKINGSGLLVPYVEGRKLHNRLLRGKQEKVYMQNGIVYVIRPETILVKKNLYGDNAIPYVVDWKYFADIDEPIDLITAEYKLKTIV